MNDDIRQNSSVGADQQQQIQPQPVSAPSVAPQKPQPKQRKWLWIVLAIVLIASLVGAAYYIETVRGEESTNSTQDASAASTTDTDSSNTETTDEPANTEPIANDTSQVPSDWVTSPIEYYGIEIRHPLSVQLEDYTGSEGRFIGYLNFKDETTDQNSAEAFPFMIFREARFGMCGVGPGTDEPGKPDALVTIAGHQVTAKAICSGQGMYTVDMADATGEKVTIGLSFLDNLNSREQVYRDILAHMQGFKPIK